MQSLTRKSCTQSCRSVGESLEWVWSEGTDKKAEICFRMYALKNDDLVFFGILVSETTCA